MTSTPPTAAASASGPEAAAKRPGNSGRLLLLDSRTADEAHETAYLIAGPTAVELHGSGNSGPPLAIPTEDVVALTRAAIAARGRSSLESTQLRDFMEWLGQLEADAGIPRGMLGAPTAVTTVRCLGEGGSWVQLSIVHLAGGECVWTSTGSGAPPVVAVGAVTAQVVGSWLSFLGLEEM